MPPPPSCRNLVIAFGFNGVGVPAASTGLVHPVWAMAAMAASVTFVLLNSFGLQVFAPTSWRRYSAPARVAEEADVAPDEDELEQAEPEADQAHRAARLDLELTGVHCSSCMHRASEGLAELAGVQSAQRRAPLGHLEVHYRASQVSPAHIAERLGELGFGIKDKEDVST